MTSLESFIRQFHLLMDKRKCTAETIYLRSAISSEEGALEFLKTFSATTGTDWVVHHGQPHFKKYVFFKTWICHRSWNKKTSFSSSEQNCNAKIDILLKKASIYTGKYPPLNCIIRLIGKHSHDSETDDGLQMVGLTSELKEKFFEYFESGLAATEARMKHDIFIQPIKNDKAFTKFNFNLTSRQVQRLYNYWMSLKDTMGYSKENTDTVEKVSFKELLRAIPKIELEDVSKEVPADPFSDGLEPPLEFVLEDSVSDSSSTSALYKLKHGLQGTFLSRLALPQISTVRIESSDESRFDDPLPKPASVPEVTIKLEPLDVSEEVDYLISACSKNFQDSSTMPVIVKYESDGLSTSPNLDAAEDSSNNNIFPLVFTFTGLTCSQYDLDSPLLYSLKHGPCELSVTSLTQLLSVQIHSTNRATLKIKKNTSTSLLTVDTFTQFEYKSQVGVEGFPNLNSQTSTHSLNESLEGDVPPCKKSKAEDSSDTYASNDQALPTLKVEASNPPELKNDEDYQFLMSLLPELKQIPPDQKQQVKRKMREFVITSRMCARRIQFEKMRSNVYRDCGSLPSLRDWKF